MAAGPQAPAAHRGARTAPTRPQGKGILLLLISTGWMLSAQDLGAASCTKRPTSCMLVLAKPLKPVKDDDEEKFKEAYSSVFDKVKASQLVF
eukprot:5551230-Pyramimonas_sp.AAC.1